MAFFVRNVFNTNIKYETTYIQLAPLSGVAQFVVRTHSPGSSRPEVGTARSNH
jgi:hypothetical protein